VSAIGWGCLAVQYVGEQDAALVAESLRLGCLLGEKCCGGEGFVMSNAEKDFAKLMSATR
jgi:hypothetical protein